MHVSLPRFLAAKGITVRERSVRVDTCLSRRDSPNDRNSKGRLVCGSFLSPFLCRTHRKGVSVWKIRFLYAETVAWWIFAMPLGRHGTVVGELPAKDGKAHCKGRAGNGCVGESRSEGGIGTVVPHVDSGVRWRFTRCGRGIITGNRGAKQAYSTGGSSAGATRVA